MGCMTSSQRVAMMPNVKSTIETETLLGALARLDNDVATSESMYSAQRLAVVAAELDGIQQEIQEFEVTTSQSINDESYAKTMHQVFQSLDIYRRPTLATENEDFIANVNRKEMRKIEYEWLRRRDKKLQLEKKQLHAQLLRLRSSYKSLQELLGCVLSVDPCQPDVRSKFNSALVLRDSLAAVSMRLRAAADYAQSALRHLDVALPVWKLATVGKGGSERTSSCSDACARLVRARCDERCARRVLAAHAAPRAARELRLALDYAFTDTMHDHKYEKATKNFLQFKEALVQLVTSVHQVLLNNVENLQVAEKNLKEYRNILRSARAREILKMGLGDIPYDPDTINKLKKYNKSLMET